MSSGNLLSLILTTLKNDTLSVFCLYSFQSGDIMRLVKGFIIIFCRVIVT